MGCGRALVRHGPLVRLRRRRAHPRRLLRGRRAEAVIVSKCGISAARPTPARRLAKAVARRVFDLAPALRTGLRGVLGAQHQGGHFAPADIVASAEASLRELGVERLDWLMLHDAPLEVARDPRVHDALAGLVERGLVGGYGLSSSVAVVAGALTLAPRPFAAVQLSDNLWDGGQEEVAAALAARSGGDGARPLVLANQPFGGGAGAGGGLGELGRRIARTVPGLELGPAAREILLRPSLSAVAEVALGAVVHGPLAPVVVCTMTDPQHIRANVRAVTAGRFSVDELVQLRRGLLAARLS
ncbi:MAG: aldo/keto reductase [Myxococcota bacterium]